MNKYRKKSLWESMIWNNTYKHEKASWELTLNFINSEERRYKEKVTRIWNETKDIFFIPALRTLLKQENQKNTSYEVSSAMNHMTR